MMCLCQFGQSLAVGLEVRPRLPNVIIWHDPLNGVS